MKSRTLMIQGTMSSVGKSLLVTGLCRLFSRRGLKVAPFKAQNMSNNAGVTPDGGEIGRAQVNQAEAAGVVPHVDMNPILLKPEADSRSQVVILGKAWASVSTGEFYKMRSELWEIVKSALDRLRDRYELVIIEGAGSPAELNLRGGDVVNMPIARYANSPVLLVGDIDRGGIFAQLLGTLWLLPDAERKLIKGFIVNKFRGDPALFEEGIRILQKMGDRPVIGVVPYLYDLEIAEEDAVAIEEGDRSSLKDEVEVDVAAVAFPRISNFDDLDALSAEPGVRVRWVSSPRELGKPDAVILPGSKSTISDLTWLRNIGLAREIVKLARKGVSVVGLCGGYQMLGLEIRDPAGIESRFAKETEGLGLLPVITTFLREKRVSLTRATIIAREGWLAEVEGQTVRGYEIHMGYSEGGKPLLKLENGSLEGAVAQNSLVFGTYLHGIFDNPNFRRAWLKNFGYSPHVSPFSIWERRQRAYDRLADALEENLNMGLLEQLIRR